jgi:metal-responsive CopG/Arc/MetJ family transcriptional regulator
MRYYQGYTLTMKTAISIPDKVFHSADSLAKRLGLSRSQLYSTAISEYLSKHQGKQITERLNSIYSEEDSSLPPSFIILQAKSLIHEEW